MKTFLSLLAGGLLLAQNASAQHYVRTRHNIGLTASYSPYSLALPGKKISNGQPGTALSLGLTKEMASVFYPELFYQYAQGTATPATETTRSTGYAMHSAGAGLLMKIDLFAMDTRKRNGYCFGRVVNVLTGVDYIQPLSAKTISSTASAKGDAGVKLGLGMYSAWGGSARKHQAWTIHWETFARYGFTSFMEDTTAPGSDKFRHASAGITLRVIHHKVYKFSDM